MARRALAVVRFVGQAEEVLAVLVVFHRGGDGAEAVGADPAVAVGDAFEAGDLQAGALLDHLDEDGGLGEGVMGPGVEPGEAAAQDLDFQLAVLQEGLVHARNFEFAAGAGLDPLGDLDDLVGVEVEADDRIVALRVRGLLFDAQAVAPVVEFGDAVALGVGDPVAEDGGFGEGRFFAALRMTGGALRMTGRKLRRAGSVFHRLLQQLDEAVAVDDVVAEDHADAVVADEVLADEEGLGEAVRGGLLGVREADAVVGAVPEQAPEAREVLRRADDQDVADPRQHQRADGVIDHRLVVDRQQLFADAFRNRVETGAGAAGEYNAFHCLMLSVILCQ